MTKVPVNIPGIAPNMTFGTRKVQDTESKGDFSKIFENQKGNNPEVTKQEEVQTEDVRKEDVTEPREAVEPSAKQSETQETETLKGQEVNDREVMSERPIEEVDESLVGMEITEVIGENELTEEELSFIMPVLEAALADVKEMLVQQMDIAPKELEVLLNEMGIEETELLNQDTLKSLLLQVNGAEDMTAILTDETLYSQIMDVESKFTEIMETVQETLQLSDEEISLVTKQVSTNNHSAKAEQPMQPIVLLETTPLNTEGVVSEQKTADGEDASSQNAGNQTFGAPSQNMFEMQNVLEQIGEVSHQERSFVSAETENIMNQIMDHMRIQLSAETDVLEMQLQPESLGTLQIRISAKEGIMTAQFTTASESVKAALESQMVQLQQQLENQNIKVDAIEVTVQTHQFESALEQGEERGQAESEKKSRTRKIDLNNLEEMNDVSDEERIVAEMMAANGSTVDYLA